LNCPHILPINGINECPNHSDASRTSGKLSPTQYAPAVSFIAPTSPQPSPTNTVRSSGIPSPSHSRFRIAALSLPGTLSVVFISISPMQRSFLSKMISLEQKKSNSIPCFSKKRSRQNEKPLEITPVLYPRASR